MNTFCSLKPAEIKADRLEYVEVKAICREADLPKTSPVTCDTAFT